MGDARSGAEYTSRRMLKASAAKALEALAESMVRPETGLNREQMEEMTGGLPDDIDPEHEVGGVHVSVMEGAENYVYRSMNRLQMHARRTGETVDREVAAEFLRKEARRLRS